MNLARAIILAAVLAIGGCSAIPVQSGPPVPPGPLGPIVQAEGAGNAPIRLAAQSRLVSDPTP